MQPILFLCLLCSGFILHAQNNLLKNPNFRDYEFSYAPRVPRWDIPHAQVRDWLAIGAVEAIALQSNVDSLNVGSLSKISLRMMRQSDQDSAVVVGICTFKPESVLFSREYLIGELSAPLVRGKSYALHFEFFNENQPWAGWEQLGFEFAEAEPSSLDMRPRVNPEAHHLKLPPILGRWATASTVITAKGGERFIIIGEFRSPQAVKMSWRGKNSVPKKQRWQIGQCIYFKYISISPVQEPAPIPGRD